MATVACGCEKQRETIWQLGLEGAGSNGKQYVNWDQGALSSELHLNAHGKPRTTTGKQRDATGSNGKQHGNWDQGAREATGTNMATGTGGVGGR